LLKKTGNLNLQSKPDFHPKKILIKMASIVPGYEYDIFISYRQKDNKYDGWVTEFVDNLKRELEATFKEDISVYFDINPHDGLLETHEVDASLKSKLKCLVFIPVISQTYCDSRSFAWQNEFCFFNKSVQVDIFGRDITLAMGNVASRILPVKIHELDREDKALIENELGSTFRCVEFIYKSPGVNRPLRANEDHPKDNLNKTYYRDQINKMANAIKEIIYGIKNFGNSVPETINEEESFTSQSEFSGKSIIVLPFENMSADPGQDYFSDGLTEEIITDLSQIRDLMVISRSSAMTFKGARKKTGEIAMEVNVRYVMEGSVRKAGNDLKINVQLIDAMNDTHLWAEKYKGTIDDIFKIQEKVSRSVVEALKIRLHTGEKRQTENLKAYDLYLLGRYYWNKRTEKGLILSIEYFEQAIKLDEDYALAIAGLSDAYYIAAEWNYIDTEKGYQRARQLANEALLLDNNIADTWATLAGIADNYEWDYVKAESLYKSAININPNYATAHQWYADYLARMGRFDEALNSINQALQLDPLSAVKNYASGLINYLGGDNETALVKFRNALKLDPDFPLVNFQIFLCLFQKGAVPDAIDEYDKLFLADASFTAKKFRGREIYNKEGKGGLLNYLIELELNKPKPSARFLAIYHSLAWNKPKALDYIEESIMTHDTDYQYIKVEPAYAVLRNEPGFTALLKKIGYQK
jgi:adenylate cyclase